MLRQDYPRFEVIAIDDRSQDRTAEIVHDLAARDSRLRLVQIDSLPEGWCGKNHAMWQGIQTAKGEWLCMIDADCRQTSDRTLSVAVRHALDGGVDLLSVLPQMEMRGFWEQVVQPVCGGVMMIWFKPQKVNSPTAPQAYANGAFMLMKRSAYEAVGTHEAVRQQPNEDMHIAARVKAGGLRLRVVRNEELYVVRMYTSLPAIIRGWSRIFFGTFGTLRRLTVSLAVLTTMGLLPYATAAVGLGGWLAGAQPGGLLLAAGLVGLAAVAMQVSVIARFYRFIHGRPGLAWTYPLGCVMAMWAAVLAIGKLRRGARLVWRATAYATQGPKPKAQNSKV
jgi:hypothetical protein